MVEDAVKSIKQSLGVEIEVVVMTSEEEYVCPYADRTVFQEGGPAIKRNISLRYTIGDLIAFFDDDVVVDKYAIFEMAAVLKRDQSVGMVFGKLLRMDDAITFDEAGSFLTRVGFLWARGDNIKDEGQFDKVEPILAGKSASCMIRRKVMVEAGLFDTSYGILGEESDLAWRVWIIGKKVMWVPKSITLHAFNTRFKPMDFYTKERVYYNGCKNYLHMLSTNLQLHNALVIVPIHYLLWLICGIGMVFKGRFEEAFHIFHGLLNPFKYAWMIRNKRAKVKAIRKKSDKEIFKYCMRSPRLSYYGSRFFRYLKGGVHG